MLHPLQIRTVANRWYHPPGFNLLHLLAAINFHKGLSVELDQQQTCHSRRSAKNSNLPNPVPSAFDSQTESLPKRLGDEIPKRVHSRQPVFRSKVYYLLPVYSGNDVRQYDKCFRPLFDHRSEAASKSSGPLISRAISRRPTDLAASRVSFQKTRMDCVGRIPQHGHAVHLGVNLLEQLKSFPAQVFGDPGQSCVVSTWPRKSCR